MKIGLSILIAITVASCHSHKPGNLPPEPEPEVTTPPLVDDDPYIPPPEPEPEPPKIFDYEPDFSPINEFYREVLVSDKEALDDFLAHQQAIALNWETSRDSGYIPRKFLESFDYSRLHIVDETNGEVDGALKIIEEHERMMKLAPVLTLKEHRSPFVIHWAENNSNVAGVHRPVNVTLSERNGEIIYNGSAITRPYSKIVIYGKNALWNYPNQTAEELDKPWGLDWTYTHEYCHHLTTAIDLNLGRSSIQTWQFTEGFASSCEAVLAGYPGQDIFKEWYEYIFEENFEQAKSRYSSQRGRVVGSHYNIRSFEDLLNYERYHETLDTNRIMTAMIDAYKRVQGIKFEDIPYPVIGTDGRPADARYLASFSGDYIKALNHQPLLVSRGEWLRHFIDIYEPAPKLKELMEADLEGQLKDEW